MRKEGIYMKKILVMIMVMGILVASCGCAESGETWSPMEIIIVSWELDESGEAKATNVDVVLSTPNACKELMDEYEWVYGVANLGSMLGQEMVTSFMGQTPDKGWTHGEFWAFPIDQNGEPLRMDLLPFAEELEVYYNL